MFIIKKKIKLINIGNSDNYQFSDQYITIPNGEFRIVSNLTIHIPQSEVSYWKIKISLGFDFLTGGSLGFVQYFIFFGKYA